MTFLCFSDVLAPGSLCCWAASSSLSVLQRPGDYISENRTSDGAFTIVIDTFFRQCLFAGLSLITDLVVTIMLKLSKLLKQILHFQMDAGHGPGLGGLHLWICLGSGPGHRPHPHHDHRHEVSSSQSEARI